MSISRRDFMSLVGTSVAGATAVAAAVRYAGAPSATSSQPDLRSWHIAEVGAVDRGAVPFTLENRTTGERLRVEACRSGSRRNPVASGGEFDLFLHNNGSGSSATQREHQLVARSLARRLDRTAAPEAVLTMDARLDKHPELFDTNDDPVLA